MSVVPQDMAAIPQTASVAPQTASVAPQPTKTADYIRECEELGYHITNTLVEKTPAAATIHHFQNGHRVVCEHWTLYNITGDHPRNNHIDQLDDYARIAAGVPVIGITCIFRLGLTYHRYMEEPHRLAYIRDVAPGFKEKIIIDESTSEHLTEKGLSVSIYVNKERFNWRDFHLIASGTMFSVVKS